MKLNNKGFSLVELLLAVMISAIVLGTVTALIMYASNSMRTTNARVALQDQGKDTMNHLESYCMEAQGASWDGSQQRLILYSSGKDALAVSNGAVTLDNLSSLTSNTYVYWFKNNKIYFGKCSSDSAEPNLVDVTSLPENNIYLLADNVDLFQCSIAQNAMSDKYTMDIKITLKDNVSVYGMEKKVYFRNQ